MAPELQSRKSAWLYTQWFCMSEPRRGSIGKNHAAEFVLRKLKLTLLFSSYFHDSLEVNNFDIFDNSWLHSHIIYIHTYIYM